jgi:hypothetical protein
MTVFALLRAPWFYVGLLAFIGLAVAASELRTALAVGAAVRANDLTWQGKLDGARAEEMKRQMDVQAASYARGLADATERAQAGEADRGQAQVIIREIAAAGGSGASCRYDAASAASLNKLRSAQ